MATDIPHVEKRQADRLRVLRAVWEATNGTTSRVARTAPTIQMQLGLSDQELEDACDYLAGGGLIRPKSKINESPGYIAVQLTHRGVREMEESISAPDKPTEHLPPAISVVHIQGDVIGSPIQSGSPGAQRGTTVQDISSEPATEKAPASESKRPHSWRLILLIAVAGLGAAVTAILGISRLYWWSLALVMFAAGAALAAVTFAITEEEEKYRILALWISNALFAALLLTAVIYEFIGPSPARTANVVTNQRVDLSAEAGVSAAKEPVTDIDGQTEGFDTGKAVTATCYSLAGSSVWLYFVTSSGYAGFAPLSDFHYQRGFPAQLPSQC